ncbi:MAG: class I SAM-dependent methyltransferase [Actinomycetota bacterium]
MRDGITRARTSVPYPPLAIRAWLRYDVVSRVIDRLNPHTVLEIGCGQGAFGARLAGRVDYLGVEPDETSYRVAAGRIEPRGGKVIKGIHEAVPEGSTFDAICAFEVLEHIDDDKGALAAWVPFIRPGGHLIMSVPAFQGRFGPMDTHAGHFRRYSPDELHSRLTEAGLLVDEITVYGWPLGYALEAVRNRIDAKRLAAAKANGISIEALTAASGRTFQPSKRSAGIAVQAATLPFRYLQRTQAQRGTGLVAVAALPAEPVASIRDARGPIGT